MKYSELASIALNKRIHSDGNLYSTGLRKIEQFEDTYPNPDDEIFDSYKWKNPFENYDPKEGKYLDRNIWPEEAEYKYN